MKLETIYPTYFQKSKIFLYPLLEIKIGAVLKPIQVYFEFENKFLAADRFLLCRFENKTDIESKKFENEVKEKVLAKLLWFGQFRISIRFIKSIC